MLLCTASFVSCNVFFFFVLGFVTLELMAFRKTTSLPPRVSCKVCIHSTLPRGFHWVCCGCIITLHVRINLMVSLSSCFVRSSTLSWRTCWRYVVAVLGCQMNWNPMFVVNVRIISLPKLDFCSIGRTKEWYRCQKIWGNSCGE